MANYHQGAKVGHRGIGYAPAGYPEKGERLDGHICGRLGVANPILCGSDGTGKHPTTAKRRDCGGKTEGSSLWAPTDGDPTGIFAIKRRVGRKKDHIPTGGTKAWSLPGHLPTVVTWKIMKIQKGKY